MLEHQQEGPSLLGSFFGPITGEKVLSFEFKYRKDLSVLFCVLLANMNKLHVESNIDVFAKAGCFCKRNTCQVTKYELALSDSGTLSISDVCPLTSGF